MKKLSIVLIILAFAIAAYAQFEIQNTTVNSVNGIVTLSYNLVAASPCKITVLVSNDAGTSYNIYPTALSGDVGDQVPAGNGKQIVWHPSLDGISEGDNYRIKIIARENPVQSEDQFTSFVKVQGGTFSRQNSDGTYPNPEVMVTLSSFYIDRYETTQSEYQAVMGNNPSSFSGYPNRPVEMVSWFDGIKYCNLRSMQEGLTPCYSYSTYGTNPNNWPAGWNADEYNHTNVSCNWSANGYRLPTEMEWMFASKGGTQSQGYTYSGSNTIGDVAWYNTSSGSRTHDVGELASNELGIFDMSGNVWERCWDIYNGSASYPVGGPLTNPTGPTSGSINRMRRGGSWTSGAANCTVSIRNWVDTMWPNNSMGFRCVRLAP